MDPAWMMVLILLAAPLVARGVVARHRVILIKDLLKPSIIRYYGTTRMQLDRMALVSLIYFAALAAWVRSAKLASLVIGLSFFSHLMGSYWITITLVLLSISYQPVYAIRVNPPAPPPSPHESSTMERLKETGPFFTFVGVMYYFLPILSFRVTKDWKKVFFDCFAPFSLWLDAIHCICVLLINLFTIRDITERTEVLASEYGGLIALFMAVNHYLTLKLMDSNQTPKLQMTKEEADKHVNWMTGVFIILNSLLFVQLSHKWYIPGVMEGRIWEGSVKGIIGLVTLLAFTCEAGQVSTAIWHRIQWKKWENDDWPIYVIKLAAAASSFLSDGYDTFCGFYVNGYLKGYYTACALIVSAVSVCFSGMLIIMRLIGPSRLCKAGVKLNEWWTATKDGVQEVGNFLSKWFNETWDECKDWAGQKIKHVKDRVTEKIVELQGAVARFVN